MIFNGAKYANTRVEELYSEYFNILYQKGYSYLGERSETEKIIETLFVKVLRGKIDLDSMDKPHLFLERAVENAAKKRLRKRRSIVVLAQHAKSHMGHPSQIPDLEIAISQFQRKIATQMKIKLLISITVIGIVAMLAAWLFLIT